jgi:RNA polymerase sigma-70 factor (ECF subfamily)
MMLLNRTMLERRLVEQAQSYLRQLAQRSTPDAETARGWSEFYEHCAPWIERFVGAMGVPAHAREDCMQEVWLNIMRYLGRLNYDPQRAQFRTWLYTLARSVSADFHRRRRDVTLASDMDMLEQIQQPADSQVVDARLQARELLCTARQELSTVNFNLLHMRFMEQRSVSETAAVLGLTARQVWFRQHRIKKKLRSCCSTQEKNEIRAQGAAHTPVSECAESAHGPHRRNESCLSTEAA